MPDEPYSRTVVQAREFTDSIRLVDATRNRLCCYDPIATLAVIAPPQVLSALQLKYDGPLGKGTARSEPPQPSRLLRLLRAVVVQAGHLVGVELSPPTQADLVEEHYLNPNPGSHGTFRDADDLLVIQKATAWLEPLLQELNQLYHEGKVQGFAAHWMDPADFPAVRLRYPQPQGAQRSSPRLVA